MKQNPLLQNIFGTIGAILWSAQLVPQIYHNYRTKSTYGLSSHLMLIWALSAIFLGVYNILQNINIALIIQPQSFGLLVTICWAQCLYYGDGPEPEPDDAPSLDPKRKHRRGISLKNTLLIFWGYVIVSVGFQCSCIFGLRAAANTHTPPQLNQPAVQFFGITSAVLITGGLIPQYIEIYRLKQVIGVSYVFMAVDALGGVFSLMSLGFKEEWDITASINYLLVTILDSGVLLLAMILNPLARQRAEQAREADERAEVQAAQMARVANSGGVSCLAEPTEGSPSVMGDETSQGKTDHDGGLDAGGGSVVTPDEYSDTITDRNGRSHTDSEDGK